MSAITKIRMVFGDLDASTREAPAGLVQHVSRVGDDGEKPWSAVRHRLWFSAAIPLRVALRFVGHRRSNGSDESGCSVLAQLVAGDMPQLTFHAYEERGARAGEMLLPPRQGGSIILAGQRSQVGRFDFDVEIEPRPQDETSDETRRRETRIALARSLDRSPNVAAAHELHAAIWAAHWRVGYRDKDICDQGHLVWQYRRAVLSDSELALATAADGWWSWDQYGFSWFHLTDEWLSKHQAWREARDT